ncbi:hypothetical protein HYPSUDRAFT_200147 [Hypholoma sublateritium FD-334 SS-4]|uniref:Uncharacterized protein n=1 Tax=Hypholoma sublateritium (strain FD-334 SS-4) TaxID=945553 RepID=A0A0D2P1R4_HYPSF|nr:hypothetical protein HYPSUDRAFT_200147 [Hypholoma sublateritium FD-334 SS-4]
MSIPLRLCPAALMTWFTPKLRATIHFPATLLGWPGPPVECDGGGCDCRRGFATYHVDPGAPHDYDPYLRPLPWVNAYLGVSGSQQETRDYEDRAHQRPLNGHPRNDVTESGHPDRGQCWGTRRFKGNTEGLGGSAIPRDSKWTWYKGKSSHEQHTCPPALASNECVAM